MPKKKIIAPPVNITTGVSTSNDVAMSMDAYKQRIEREYAPEPKKEEPKKVRVFVGVGVYLPVIKDKRIKINFQENPTHQYATNNPDIIAYLEEKGFKEVEL